MRFGLCCIITVVTQLCIGSALNIKCVYNKIKNWPSVESLYSCEVTNTLKITKPNEIITSNGTHASGKNNSMVEEIYFQNLQSKINFFPKGIDNIFPNIKSIHFENVGLKEIHQGDLKTFPDLEVLHLSNNKLEYIEKDLFKYNTNLKAFDIRNNPITYIDPNVFAHLKALTTLYIAFCNVGYAVNNRSQVMQVIQQIKEHCSKPSDLAKYLYSKEDEKVTSETTSEENPTTSIIEIKEKSHDNSTEVKELNEKYEKEVKNLTERLENLLKNEANQSHACDSRLRNALITKNILIFIVFPIVGIVTILNIFLIIVCLRKRFFSLF